MATSVLRRTDTTPTSSSPDPALIDLLNTGQIELIGLLPGSSNYTILCSIDAGPEPTLVVYKPQRGETPLWDFPSGTLCHREVAACVVDRYTGWNFVPPTVLREGPLGLGSVQLFIEHDSDVSAFDVGETHRRELMRIALFDIVVNNADRKAGHVILGSEGIKALDHGICFHEEPKLRTVLWDFVGERINAEDLDVVRRIGDAVSSDLGAELEYLLSAAEIDAIRLRAEALCDEGRFPPPRGGRPYPWPPV